MKILRLCAENIKRLVAVEIVPDGDVVTIAGKNGQGKTSVLDSIWWALAGAGVIQGEPIRKGQDRARIRLELGEGREVELIAERKFRRGKSELTFVNADGSPTKLPPQAMADSLIGALSFDPLAFSRMKPREQFDELRRIAKLEVDIEELDRLNAADYAKRTDVNREAKAKEAAARIGDELLAAAPVRAKVDTRAILDQIEGAAAQNKKLAERREKRRAFEQATVDLEARAASNRREAARMREVADQMESAAGADEKSAAGNRDLIASAGPLPEPIDVSDLRRALDDATATNSAIEDMEAAAKRRRDLFAEAAQLKDASDSLTAAMEKREHTKREAIQGAQLPVEGLGFGEGIVTLNGLPLDQAGAAARWRVCVAIAMAQHPRLRVIRIDEGSLLDSDAMAILAEMARENDWQCWVEVVQDNATQGFVIEDGAVKEG